jgi:hypothetical protein
MKKPARKGGSLASVHPWAAAVMREYLAWRGHLEDREAPLFLTDERFPMSNGKAAGGQTKTAFKGMVRRTRAALRHGALIEAAKLRRQGTRGRGARALVRDARRCGSPRAVDPALVSPSPSDDVARDRRSAFDDGAGVGSMRDRSWDTATTCRLVGVRSSIRWPPPSRRLTRR